RSDPTRYWSALVLATAVAAADRARVGGEKQRSMDVFLARTATGAERANSLEEAAALFTQRTGIRFEVRAFADARAPIRYFAAGLVRNDVRHSLAACTPFARRLLADELDGMASDQRTALGQLFARAVGVAIEEGRVRFGVATDGGASEKSLRVVRYRG